MKFLATLCLGLLVMCAAAAPGDKTVNVGVGESFKLTLESNPSTGNQWMLARPLDDRLLKLLGSEYKRGRPGAAGAPGHEILSFKALAEGKTQIYLKYGRLWEHDAAPALTTNFVVVITKTGPGSR